MKNVFEIGKLVLKIFFKIKICFQLTFEFSVFFPQTLDIQFVLCALLQISLQSPTFSIDGRFLFSPIASAGRPAGISLTKSIKFLPSNGDGSSQEPDDSSNQPDYNSPSNSGSPSSTASPDSDGSDFSSTPSPSTPSTTPEEPEDNEPSSTVPSAPSLRTFYNSPIYYPTHRLSVSTRPPNTPHHFTDDIVRSDFSDGVHRIVSDRQSYEIRYSGHPYGSVSVLRNDPLVVPAITPLRTVIHPTIEGNYDLHYPSNVPVDALSVYRVPQIPAQLFSAAPLNWNGLRIAPYTVRRFV